MASMRSSQRKQSLTHDCLGKRRHEIPLPFILSPENGGEEIRYDVPARTFPLSLGERLHDKFVANRAQEPNPPHPASPPVGRGERPSRTSALEFPRPRSGGEDTGEGAGEVHG